MSDDKTPLEVAVDQAMDAFVYAPIGLIFDGPALFPTLVQKGRNQVQVARMMGEMAVQMGQTELTKRATATSGPVRDVLAGIGLVDSPTDNRTDEASTDQPAPKANATPSTPAKTTKRASTGKKVAKKAAPARARTSRSGAKAAQTADALGITDYDSLSASQVVQRLRGLVPKELDAVKVYESANRARKTVLNKIIQLQDLRG